MAVTDAIYGPIRILIIIVTFFVCFFIWNSFTGVFETSLLPSVNPLYQQELNQTISNVDVGLRTIDYMIPFIIIGLLIVSLVFAFKTGASVVYAVLSIIIWVFALILSAIFTNTYLQIDETLNLGSTFIISNYIMTNLKWITLGWLAIISIVIFSRNKQETQSISASEQVWQ